MTFEVTDSTKEDRDKLRSFLEDNKGEWEKLDSFTWNFTCPTDTVDEFTDLLDCLNLNYRNV